MNYILYALIALLTAATIILFVRLQKANSANTYKDSIIAEQNDSIDYYYNRQGQLISEKLAAESNAKEIAKAYPALAKELKDEFDVKMNEVKAYVKNTFQARGEGNAEIHNHYTLADSSGRRYPYWELKATDGYLNFRATVSGADSLHAPYTYTYADTITTVIHTTKKWLFGKERLVASTTFKNPNAKAMESTNILINNVRDKRFAIGVGFAYAPFPENFYPVIYAGFNLLKF